MKHKMNKLLFEMNNLCVLIRIFSEAFEYCIDDGKNVEHLYSLQKFILKRALKVRNTCDRINLTVKQ